MREGTVGRLNDWGAVFRLITPVLVTISLFLLTQIHTQLRDIGERLYSHQTNAEIHLPRSEIIELRRDMADMKRDLIQVIKDLYPKETSVR